MHEDCTRYHTCPTLPANCEIAAIARVDCRGLIESTLPCCAKQRTAVYILELSILIDILNYTNTTTKIVHHRCPILPGNCQILQRSEGSIAGASSRVLRLCASSERPFEAQIKLDRTCRTQYNCAYHAIIAAASEKVELLS